MNGCTRVEKLRSAQSRIYCGYGVVVGRRHALWRTCVQEVQKPKTGISKNRRSKTPPNAQARQYLLSVFLDYLCDDCQFITYRGLLLLGFKVWNSFWDFGPCRPQGRRPGRVKASADDAATLTAAYPYVRPTCMFCSTGTARIIEYLVVFARGRKLSDCFFHP